MAGFAVASIAVISISPLWVTCDPDVVNTATRRPSTASSVSASGGASRAMVLSPSRLGRRDRIDAMRSSTFSRCLASCSSAFSMARSAWRAVRRFTRVWPCNVVHIQRPILSSLETASSSPLTLRARGSERELSATTRESCR